VAHHRPHTIQISGFWAPESKTKRKGASTEQDIESPAHISPFSQQNPNPTQFQQPAGDRQVALHASAVDTKQPPPGSAVDYYNAPGAAPASTIAPSETSERGSKKSSKDKDRSHSKDSKGKKPKKDRSGVYGAVGGGLLGFALTGKITGGAGGAMLGNVYSKKRKYVWPMNISSLVEGTFAYSVAFNSREKKRQKERARNGGGSSSDSDSD
jgi:hypothetical protein